MNKALFFLVLSLRLSAGVIVDFGSGNDGRQCPASPALLPVSLLDRAAPQNNFCYSYPPPLIGYLDPYNPGREIVWTPLVDFGPAALTLDSVSAVFPAVPPDVGPSGSSASLFAPITPPALPNPVVVTPTPDPIQVPTGAMPEPATGWLIAAGMGTLALMRLRPRRAK